MTMNKLLLCLMALLVSPASSAANSVIKGSIGGKDVMKAKRLLLQFGICVSILFASPTGTYAQSARKSNPEMTRFFKMQINEYPSETGLFKKGTVATRVQKLLGQRYGDIANIYQAQVPIEFRDGMFYSFGFQAHNCCDPFLIWAYDSRCDSFYFFIRKNNRDTFFSETGKIPYEFKEIVSANIL